MKSIPTTTEPPLSGKQARTIQEKLIQQKEALRHISNASEARLHKLAQIHRRRQQAEQDWVAWQEARERAIKLLNSAGRTGTGRITVVLGGI